MSSTAALMTPVASGWAKACGVCRRTYGTREWDDLPVVSRLPSGAVQPYLSVPASWSIELRQCECGVPLATRSR